LEHHEWFPLLYRKKEKCTIRGATSGLLHLLSGTLVWVRRLFLDEIFLPRKGLERKYRRNCGAIPRNWSGKPGFCVPGTQKCALIGLEKSKCRNPGATYRIRGPQRLPGSKETALENNLYIELLAKPGRFCKKLLRFFGPGPTKLFFLVVALSKLKF
jgi:hypothetical protein